MLAEKVLPLFLPACQLIKDNFWLDTFIQSSPNASGFILLFENGRILALSMRSRSIETTHL
jgi:hypothetical protein